MNVTNRYEFMQLHTIDINVYSATFLLCRIETIHIVNAIVN